MMRTSLFLVTIFLSSVAMVLASPGLGVISEGSAMLKPEAKRDPGQDGLINPAINRHYNQKRSSSNISDNIDPNNQLSKRMFGYINWKKMVTQTNSFITKMENPELPDTKKALANPLVKPSFQVLLATYKEALPLYKKAAADGATKQDKAAAKEILQQKVKPAQKKFVDALISLGMKSLESDFEPKNDPETAA